jgi:tetratricopeptide (TPR) repeat protein
MNRIADLQTLANAAQRAHQTGDLVAAERDYRAFLSQAEHPAILSNFAALLIRTQRHAEALPLLERAARLMPNSGAVLGNLGAAAWKSGNPARGALALQQALMLEPSLSDGWSNLAGIAVEAKQFDAAVAALGRARHLSPNQPGPAFNRGVVLQRKGATRAAVEAYRETIALAPAMPEPRANLAACLADLGQFDEADAAFEQALTLVPNQAAWRFSRAQLRLAMGDWSRGWEEFEARWDLPAVAGKRPAPAAPEWRGEDLTDRTLLLTAEQGQGDMIKFLRFVPDLAERAGRLVLELPPALAALAAWLHPKLEIITPGGNSGPVDFALPLMSLSRPLWLAPDNLPRGAYLAADPRRLTAWRAKVRPGPLRAGLVWAGNPDYVLDHFRSPGFAAVRPLLDVPGVAWHLLQVGPGRAQLTGQELPEGVVDLGPELGDFADTAAVMANLDVVVSSDTATAHLAAALGRDTRVLVPALLDWRWAEAADGRALWYERARIYRQVSLGDWNVPVERLAIDLEVLAGD